MLSKISDVITISFSVVPFSSCLQFSPASGSFPMSRLFPSGGQSIGASASASALLMSIQGQVPLGLTSVISSDLLAVQGSLKSLLQHHSLKVSILQCSAFFMVQLPHPYIFIKRGKLDIAMYRRKTMWRHREKMAIYKPKREASEETNPVTPWS